MHAGQGSGGEGEVGVLGKRFWGRLGEVRVQGERGRSGFWGRGSGRGQGQEGGKVSGEEGEVGVQGGQGLGWRGRSGF